jgi:hypothetical protein
MAKIKICFLTFWSSDWTILQGTVLSAEKLGSNTACNYMYILISLKAYICISLKIKIILFPTVFFLLPVSIFPELYNTLYIYNMTHELYD